MLFEKGVLREATPRNFKFSARAKSHSKNARRAWLYLKQPNRAELEAVGTVFGLHPTTIEDLANPSTRIKYEEFDNYTFVVFRGIKNLSNNKVHMYSIYAIDGQNFLITVIYDDNDTIDNLLANTKKTESLLKKGEDFLLHHILDLEVDKYLLIRTTLSDNIKELESSILKRTRGDLLDALFEKELLTLDIKQRVDSLTEVFRGLKKPTDNFIDNDLIPYFRDIYDHIVRVDETLTYTLERIDSVRNTYVSMNAQKMNETMRLLTVITTVFMPISFLAAFYGMNVVLPGQSTISTTYILAGIMIIIILCMLYVFKKMGFFPTIKNKI